MISINKKLFILCSCITIIIVSLSLFNVISYYSSSNQILESTTYTDNFNLISVYIEDEEGNYVLSETSNFDQGTDYVYNEEKSYCVNESVLSYNEDTSKISVTASGTDICYVYFDENKIINNTLEITSPDAETYGVDVYSILTLNGILVSDLVIDNILNYSSGDILTCSNYFAMFEAYIFIYDEFGNELLVTSNFCDYTLTGIEKSIHINFDLN